MGLTGPRAASSVLQCECEKATKKKEVSNKRIVYSVEYQSRGRASGRLEDRLDLIVGEQRAEWRERDG